MASLACRLSLEASVSSSLLGRMEDFVGCGLSYSERFCRQILEREKSSCFEQY